jgi:polysaccharide chain length determinant protein (PEP-CTERM system associated)
MRERQASRTTQFLKVQLEEAKNRLDEQDAQLRDFRTRHTGELPQQTGVNLATVERLQSQIHLNSANQLRAIEQRAVLVRQLAESDAAGVVGPPDTGTAKLAKLKRELADLRTNFSEKYPDVIRLKREIAALERDLAEAKPEGSPGADAAAGRGDPPVPLWRTALNQIDAEIKSLKAEEQRLRRQIESYQRRIENAPQREQEFQELSRSVETARDLYASLLKRYEDAQLAENMEQSRQGEQFRILDPAISAKQPTAPNRFRLAILGVLLAFGAAGAVATLAEHLDTSFHTFDDLRTFTRVPVLASIPRIVSDADMTRQMRQRWLATASIALGLALIVAASYHLAHGNDQLVRLLSRGAS